MSAVSDAMRAVKDVLLMQSTVERLEKEFTRLGGDFRGVQQSIAEIDKRVVRIETMIEMSARQADTQPRIEG